MNTYPAPTRRLTVCRKNTARSQRRWIAVPELRLQGKWLQAAGFRSGHVVDITCSTGQLIITIAQEQRFEGL